LENGYLVKIWTDFSIEGGKKKMKSLFYKIQLEQEENFFFHQDNRRQKTIKFHEETKKG